MWPSPTALHFPSPGRILLVTNLLDLEMLLPVALRYASRAHAKLKLLHTLPGLDASFERRFPHSISKLDARKSHAEMVLTAAALRVQHASVDCSWALHIGDLSRALTEIEDAWSPDRVIVARSEIVSEWGSLDPAMETVLRETSVPVLVVGPNGNSASGMREEKKSRILFATSLDRDARDVAALVLRFARNQQAELTMLHVIDSQSSNDAWFTRVKKYADERFREIAGDLAAGEVRYIVKHGRVAETLLHVAKAQNYDFILIGFVSGASFRTDIQPGSAYKIVCKAPCPVLVLKRDSLFLSSGASGFEAEITTPYPELVGKNL